MFDTPGQAVAARTRREKQLLGEVTAAMDEFLFDVDSLTAAVTARPHPTANLRARWMAFVLRVDRHIKQLFVHPDRPMSQMYLSRLAMRLSSMRVPDDVAQAVNDTITDATRHNKSWAQTQREVARAVRKQRDTAVLRIARTEATASYNFSELDFLAWENYSTKMWVPVGDAATRPTHMAAAGQVQRLADPFQVGGELLMVPGDPQGSGAQIANCRCVVVGADRKR